MEDKITIIEGPPPTFEAVADGWVSGLNESARFGHIAVTRLRTFNGPSLVERCYRAWHQQQNIHLEFRTSDGLENQAPIVAARSVEVEEGHLLILWVRLADDDVQFDIEYDDDASDDNDDDLDDLDGIDDSDFPDPL
jgi:hypothetical protein